MHVNSQPIPHHTVLRTCNQSCTLRDIMQSEKNRIKQDVPYDAAPVWHGTSSIRSTPYQAGRCGIPISQNARDTATTVSPAACGTLYPDHIPQNTGWCLTGYNRIKRDDTARNASQSVPPPSGYHHCLRQDISSCETRDDTAHKNIPLHTVVSTFETHRIKRDITSRRKRCFQTFQISCIIRDAASRGRRDNKPKQESRPIQDVPPP